MQSISSQSQVRMTQQQYDNLMKKMNTLENQNKSLKDTLMKISSQRVISSRNSISLEEGDDKLCKHCDRIFLSELCIPAEKLKQQWTEWSKTFESTSKYQQIMNDFAQIPSILDEGTNSKYDGIKQEIEETPLRLVEALCLYGPNKQEILDSTSKTFTAKAVIYSADFKAFDQYGQCFFPEQINVKRIREQKEDLQTNRIIFKKNTKRQDTSVYLFQAQEKHPILDKNCKSFLAKKINAGNKLYAFNVVFTDFLIFSQEQFVNFKQEDLNCTSKGIPENEQQPDIKKFTKKLSLVENLGIDKKSSVMFLSKFCLVLFTYFPFVNIFERMLIKIIDEIKINRMQLKTNHPDAMKDIDINYVNRSLNTITKKFLSEINSIPAEIGHSVVVQLGGQTFDIALAATKIDEFVFQNWAINIVKMFNKDTFYEILCYILMEESVCFLCQDMYVLTHTFLLFADLLLKPLYSPHPYNSVALKQGLLGSPFILTLGINKSQQWLQDNLDLLAQNKVIVNLNNEISIKSNTKPKYVRSEKLKKHISQFYKKLQPTMMPSFFRKKETANKLSPLDQEVQNLYAMLDGIENYFWQEIINYLPTKETIKTYSQELQGQNDIALCKKLIQIIENSFKTNRKKQKDPLIEQLCARQLFYVFVCDMFGLN